MPAPDRHIKDFIPLHFTFHSKKMDRSNRSFWECKHCQPEDRKKIEHRDNRLLLHLMQDCKGVPADVKTQAGALLIQKVGVDEVFTFPTPRLLEADGTPTDGSSTNSRKRIREDTVESAGIAKFVDRTLTEKQTKAADALFLR
ncbi:hypothetical protein EIP86_007492, partial [Pleurotus ostreatoroseus]